MTGEGVVVVVVIRPLGHSSTDGLLVPRPSHSGDNHFVLLVS